MFSRNMQRESWHREFCMLALTIIFLFTLFFLTFTKESILRIGAITLQLAYLFIIPGYCLLLQYREKWIPLKRILYGTLLQIAFLITVSYGLGVAGIPIRYHVVGLPLLAIAIGVYLYLRSYPVVRYTIPCLQRKRKVH